MYAKGKRTDCGSVDGGSSPLVHPRGKKMEQITNREDLVEVFYRVKEHLFKEGASFVDEDLDNMSAVMCSFPFLGKEKLTKEEIEENTPLILAIVKDNIGLS